MPHRKLSCLVFSLLSSLFVRVSQAVPTKTSNPNAQTSSWGPYPPGGWDGELGTHTRPGWLMDKDDVTAILNYVAADPAPDNAIISSTWNKTIPGNSVVFVAEPFATSVPLYFGNVRYFAKTEFPNEYQSLHIDPPCWIQTFIAITKKPKGTRGGLYAYARLTLQPATVPLGVSNETVQVSGFSFGSSTLSIPETS